MSRGSAVLPYLEIAASMMPIFAIALDHSFEPLANRIVVRAINFAHFPTKHSEKL